MTGQVLATRTGGAFLSKERGGAAIGMGDLTGKILLYVGGRTNQVPKLRKIAEERGADLLHHDGGLAESSSSLARLALRADAILFPVDCISHSAATAVKKICKQLGKSYFPLRRSGPASFAALIQHLDLVAEA
jgi:hypothetical protein